MEDVLKSDYYKSPLGYDNVDWFVDEVIKLETKMAFYFKNIKKEINMKDKDEKIIEMITFADFVKKKYCLIKLEIIVT